MIGMFQKLFRYLLTGTFFLLPFVITAGIVAWIGLFIANYLGPNTLVGKWLVKIGLIYFQTNYPILSYIIGILIVLTIIMLIGFIIERRGIKKIVEVFSNWVKRIPIIGNFYNSMCSLVNTLDKDKLGKPVYCHFGSIIILALQPTSDVFVINGKNYLSIIIPTAPVPAGGAVMMLPEEDVTPADIKIDEFMSFYFSMGVTGKDFIQILNDAQKNIAQKK